MEDSPEQEQKRGEDTAPINQSCCHDRVPPERREEEQNQELRLPEAQNQENHSSQHQPDSTEVSGQSASRDTLPPPATAVRRSTRERPQADPDRRYKVKNPERYRSKTRQRKQWERRSRQEAERETAGQLTNSGGANAHDNVAAPHGTSTQTPESEAEAINLLQESCFAAAVTGGVIEKDPTTWQEALSGPHASEWLAGAEARFQEFIENGVWELVPRPKGRKVIKNKPVFKTKYDSDMTIERRTVRIAGKGYDQVFGVDFTDTLSSR